jgi:signal transduction histidine kinase
MSLRTKVLAAVLALNGALVLFALLVLLREPRAGGDAKGPAAARDLSALASTLAASTEDLDAGNVPEPVLASVVALRRSGVVTDVFLVEERGIEEPEAWRVAERTLESVPEEEAGPVLDRFRHARRQDNQWADDEGAAYVLPKAAPEAPRRGVVLTFPPRAAPRQLARDAYLVMVGGVLLLAVLSVWLVSRLVVTPLERLAEASRRIAEGDFGLRLAGRGTNDEFDRTIHAFNRMASEIAEYQGHLEDRVLTALTRIRRAEQHLAIAQRLAATGNLAAGIAHEVNNPLGGMKNAVRAIARGDLSPEKRQEYLELVNEGLSRVEETMKKFLSFTPRRMEPRPVDLADVTRKALALAMHRVERARIRLDVDLPPPGEVQVFGDASELQQVALNLMLNAVDAVEERVRREEAEEANAPPEVPGEMPDGGPTGCLVGVLPEDLDLDAPRLRVAVRTHGAEAILEVEDDGVGMSQEDQDRCFDFFFTTKPVGEGTGLGLAVVHTIVTSHGGGIEVESEPGVGTLFRVRLPVEGPPAEEDGLAESRAGQGDAVTR